MSFILDALRKSESERQREIAPSLAHAPLAGVRRETPGWVWLVIALLSLALVASGAAWWRSGSNETPRLTRNAPATVSAVAPPRDPSTEQPRLAPAETNNPQPIRPIADLANVDPGLGELRLELLAYNSGDPASGSAWINGRRYFLGDRIGNGPELVEIRVDGVVLAHRGERFLLTPR
jgi:general secretion pathway protein B